MSNQFDRAEISQIVRKSIARLTTRFDAHEISSSKKLEDVDIFDSELTESLRAQIVSRVLNSGKSGQLSQGAFRSHLDFSPSSSVSDTEDKVEAGLTVAWRPEIG